MSDCFAGYGKFESLGTIAVSVLLILGGFGVGLHSYGALLTESIEPLLPRLSPDSLAYSILLFLVSSAPSPDEHDHAQSETTGGLSPVALFFPILSIVVKEWLYRLMSGIAKETGSSVLLANALHHRSDAWGSLISLLAIFGGIFLPGYGVDPLGGAFVSSLLVVCERPRFSADAVVIIRYICRNYDPDLGSEHFWRGYRRTHGYKRLGLDAQCLLNDP